MGSKNGRKAEARFFMKLCEVEKAYYRGVIKIVGLCTKGEGEGQKCRRIVYT